MLLVLSAQCVMTVLQNVKTQEAQDGPITELMDHRTFNRHIFHNV